MNRTCFHTLLESCPLEENVISAAPFGHLGGFDGRNRTLPFSACVILLLSALAVRKISSGTRC